MQHRDLPSGNDCYIAIENDPVEIVDFPINHGGSFHSYVSLPEGTHHIPLVGRIIWLWVNTY